MAQQITEEKNALKKFTTMQLLYFCLGFFGLQFAWQMRLALSGPVTEGLGADPLIYGLISLAGPFSGMVVQPIIGALSDKTTSRFGRRRPYLLGGAILASLALWAFPNSSIIAQFFGNSLGVVLAPWAGLAVAAVMIWIIDACVNVAQGPYRALVPDVVPQEQHGLANSFLSFAIGLGSVVAAATPPVLSKFFNITMSIPAQFLMAAIAFTGAMLVTCIAIKEKQYIPEKKEENNDKGQSFWASLKDFLTTSPEIIKICTLQFFTWIGVMCLLLYFTLFVVHNLYGVPDIVAEGNATSYDAIKLAGTNFALISLALFNLVCFVVSIPIGVLSTKYGNKLIHAICMFIMAISYIVLAFAHTNPMVMIGMGLAGIGWASILSLPFAMLSQYIKPGSEGSVMGIFNIFIAGPQVVVCTLVAWFINHSSSVKEAGIYYHWEYAFIVGAIVLACAAIAALMIKEKN
ncbi:MAG: MFS transporter [Candidatus Gastranaerophilales bacterium]|nr:MFS transporter [Candidatus Gastranaerophilales bacterium]